MKFAKEAILTAITSYSCLLLLRLPFCHAAPISYLGSNLHARPHHQSRLLKSNVQGYVRTIHAFSLPLCYARWNTWAFHRGLSRLSLKLLEKGDSDHVGPSTSAASPLPLSPCSAVLLSSTLPLPSWRGGNTSPIFECFSLRKTQSAEPSP